MRFAQIIWLPVIEEKLFHKHRVIRREVEEALKSKPLVKFVEKGQRPGEDIYAAYGRTEAGRYLIIFFIAKPDKVAQGLWKAKIKQPSPRQRLWKR